MWLNMYLIVQVQIKLQRSAFYLIIMFYVPIDKLNSLQIAK
jgi:hypothetical protein